MKPPKKLNNYTATRHLDRLVKEVQALLLTIPQGISNKAALDVTMATQHLQRVHHSLLQDLFKERGWGKLRDFDTTFGPLIKCRVYRSKLYKNINRMGLGVK